ncbi:MAG: hypothetical protein ACLQIQ_15220 [Beijerinckiaceae bacterium]
MKVRFTLEAPTRTPAAAQFNQCRTIAFLRDHPGEDVSSPWTHGSSSFPYSQQWMKSAVLSISPFVTLRDAASLSEATKDALVFEFTMFDLPASA